MKLSRFLNNSFLLVLLTTLFLPVGRLSASKKEKGFRALAEYDYFKARRLFLKINRKSPDPHACYGLACIFGRQDNPFSNSDSAVRYVNLSFNLYRIKRKPIKLAGFLIDSLSIQKLADSIAQYQFNRARKLRTIPALDLFLTRNYLAAQNLLKQAVDLRDELEYNHVLEVNKSDTTAAFIATHPLSVFLSEALGLKDRQLYNELTDDNLPSTFVSFIKTYPANVMIKVAYEKLFSIYRGRSDVAGLANFVKNYPLAPQSLEAWKLLFSLSVKAFSYTELKRFLEEYPAFPLKNSILKELELNKLELYRCQRGDFTGFINVEGKFVIAPAYDAATDFYEGLAVVNKNDSVFFINKENNDPFYKIYDDAMVFRNGLAPVKQKGRWHFINRQGQTIPGSYDEISELSNSVYVVKIRDKYGALDQYGQVLIEPRFDKLGDFKNGFAYYSDNGTFGFVSVTGAIHKAEFEWISDFDEQQVATIKQNNKYGLIDGNGRKILEPMYDQVIRARASLYQVVSNNSYGFFSISGCFVIQVAYDFIKEKTPAFYTNGDYFKLLKKADTRIVDENGQTLLSTDNYDEIHFISDGLIRVKKKKKYGYLDRKLTVAIPFRYAQAGDFEDSVAIVVLKDKHLLINRQGKELFSSGQPIEKLSLHHYLVQGDVKTIINNKGEVIVTDVANVDIVNQKPLIITLQNGEIKLIND